MKTFICDIENKDRSRTKKCGNINSVIFIIRTGGRLIEGIEFKAEIKNDKVIVKTCEDIVLCGLDKKYWLDYAEKYFSGLDIAECFLCGNQVLTDLIEF